MPEDYEKLSLRELIQLQSELVATMRRRFQKNLALAFTDVVGSTAYFARFGDVAGRAMQQRHFDLLGRALEPVGGRIVDTAGDGAFACFPRSDAAATAAIALQRSVEAENRDVTPEHRLVLRIGVHWGPALTDGDTVSGDAVNLCARIASASTPGEIRLSREAFSELPGNLRARCRALPPVELKGIPEPVVLMSLPWRDARALPTQIRVRETKEQFPIPNQPRVTFGRLDEEQEDGSRANDVVLRLPDEASAAKISRWHFELRLKDDGLVLRALSDSPTTVDGAEVTRGQEASVRIGTIVRLSNVMTLMLLGDDQIPSGRHQSTVLG